MKVSLIVPCFNEEANLQKGVLDKIGNFTKEDGRYIEVIIVDDGSTDRSKQIIKDKYLPKFSKFKLLANAHQGKAASLIAGIKEASGTHVLFTDIDLATPIEEAPKLVDAGEKGAQIVIGSREATRSGAPYLRKLMALGFIMIRDLLINLEGIKDSQCGFKLFDRKVALSIIKKLRVFAKTKKVEGSSVSAGFDLEFLFLARKLDYKIAEVPVIWKHVETKNVNFIHDSLETLRDIFKIKNFDIKGTYK